MKNALFRNLKLWWVTSEGWLPCESFPRRWLALAERVGLCWPDTETCHTTARTNTLKGEKTRQACNFGGKKVSLSGEGRRMVISRTAQNYLGSQQPCPAPSPQVIPPSAAALGNFWVTSDPSRSAVSIPPTSPQRGRMDLNTIHSYQKESRSARGRWG